MVVVVRVETRRGPGERRRWMGREEGGRLLSPRWEDWHREAAAGGGGEGGDEHGKGREEAWDGNRRRRPKIF